MSNDRRMGRTQSSALRLWPNTGANFTGIEKDGTLVFNGDATVWNDIIFPTSNLKPGVTTPDWALIVGNIYGYVFADAKTQELHGCNEIYHDWKEGTNLRPHIHWSPTTTDTGTVRFGLEYAWRNHLEDGMTTDTIYAEQSAIGTVGMHQIIDFSEIVGTGKLIGANMCFRLFRDGTHANDTFTGGAFVPTLGIHYECDTSGSRQEYIK